jgi:hypothetical protein
MDPHHGRPHRTILLTLAGCSAVLFGLAVWFSRAEGHWSVDSAVWELMAREVSRRGLDGLWVTNPAGPADPQGRFFPSFFFVRQGERYHFAFQPAFGLLSALPYGLAGKLGLTALPILAALGLAWVVASGAEQLKPGWGWAGAALLLLATPVPLYAATAWNHLPSVALLTAGAYTAWRTGLQGPVRPRGMFVAGACVGLGLLFRNEAYVYAVALVIAWLVAARQARWRGALWLLAGFAAGWTVQAALNLSLFGSAFGVKAESVAARQASSATDLGYRLWNLYLFLAAPDFSVFLLGGAERGLLMFVPVVVAAGVLALPHVERRLPVAAVALWAVAGVTIAVLAGRTQVTGLFWVAPFLVLAFLHRPRAPLRVMLWTLAVLFAVGVVWSASHGGFQWGPRYLLALYPLGVWLALDAWVSAEGRVREALRVPASVLVLLGVLAQAAGVDHADQGQWRATQALRTVRATRTQYVVVGLEIFAWDFAPAYGERVLMSVDSQEELEAAVRALAAAGVPAFTYVPRSGLRFDRRVVERVESGGRRYRVQADEAQGDLRLVEYRLVRP